MNTLEVEERTETVLPQEAVEPEEREAPWARWELLAYLLILLAALSLRLWDLGGQALHHDESLHAIYSWYLYEGRGYLHDPMMHGPFQFFGTASVYWLLWDSDAMARLLPALFGTVLVALPLLLRCHLGRSGALVTSVLLAFSPTMLYFSRFARNDIYMAVWTLALVAFMWRYLDTRKTRYLVLAAAALAFAFATKETAYILVAVLGSYLFIHAATDVVPWLLGRRSLRNFSPAGGFLVLIATLTLPLGAAGIALFQDRLGLTLANPEWTTAAIGIPIGTGLYVAFFAVVGLFIAAIAIGLRWRAWVWLVCFGTFATIWVLMYTSFFTNFWGGLSSGLWQSLGYWVVQQDVARGGQPWYYYLVLGLNYEFLPILVGTVAIAYYLVRGNRFSLFLVYWAVVNVALYSYAAEKMPWLLVGVSLPFFLLAGKFLGGMLERRPWGRVTPSQIELQAPICPQCQWVNNLEARFCASCGTPLPAEASSVPIFSLPRVTPSRGGSVNSRLRFWLHRIHWSAVAFTFMTALLVAVAGRWLLLVVSAEAGLSTGLVWLLALLVPALAASCVYLLRQTEKRRRAALVSVSLAGMMLALSVPTALRVAYVNADVPVELLVYTQTAPDIPQVMAEIQRLGEETGKERDLRITVDSTDGFSWPWAWYLRSYPLVGYPCLSSDSNCQGMNSTPDADVVLLAARNRSSGVQYLSAYRPPLRYKHRWWFPESYRGVDLGTVAEGIRTRESWCKVVRYFWDREFGLPVGSIDGYAYFPQDFTPAPVGREGMEKGTSC